MDLLSYNWLAIILAAISSFALGFIWYLPQVFGKIWQRLAGLSDEAIRRGNLFTIFGSAFGLSIIMSAILYPMVEGRTFLEGFTLGLVLGVGFLACSMGINYLYQRKSIVLWLIDAGYQVLSLALMGGIIAVMGS
jgi:Protein of unknown function (DUF1761)